MDNQRPDLLVYTSCRIHHFTFLHRREVPCPRVLVSSCPHKLAVLSSVYHTVRFTAAVVLLLQENVTDSGLL